MPRGNARVEVCPPYVFGCGRASKSVWSHAVPSTHREDAHDDRGQALPRKRVLERAELVKQAAKRPDVRLAVVGAILADLRAQVVRRADDLRVRACVCDP
jgi:hypothetical protein